MRSSVCGFLAAVVGLWSVPPSTVGQEPKSTEGAKKALMRFWVRLQAKDLKGLAKTAEVPFCFNEGDPDSIVGKLIKDRGELDNLLKELLDGSKEKNATLTINATLTHAEFVEATGDILKKDGKLKKERDVLDDLLEKEGYVLLARVGEKGKDIPMGFLVAARKEEAKVVGILIGLTDPRKN